jgi:hypothetical protein
MVVTRNSLGAKSQRVVLPFFIAAARDRDFHGPGARFVTVVEIVVKSSDNLRLSFCIATPAFVED